MVLKNSFKILLRVSLSSLFFAVFYFVIPHSAFAAISAAPNVNEFMTDGVVNTSVLGSDGTVYVGGNFSNVGLNAPSQVPLDATMGSALSVFPNVNGTIDASISDGSGGWYIGGSFTQVGTFTRNNIAHILSDGTVDASFDPNVDHAVSALAFDGATLYAGGNFKIVNGGATQRNYLAAFSTSGTQDGIATPWNPDPDSEVYALALSADTRTLYVGGDFNNVNTETSISTVARNYLAAFSSGSGVAQSWDPEVDSDVYALAISGSTIYAGGDFSNANTATTPVTRNYLAAFNNTDGTVTSWDPEVDNEVDALAISGSTIYAGGNFTTANITTTPVTRSYLAAFNNTDGTVTSWDPEVDSSVYAISVSGLPAGTVYVGGDFLNANTGTTPAARSYLAAFNNTDGTVTPWDPEVDSDVDALVISGSTVYAGGDFDMVNVVARSNLAAFNGTTGAVTAWNPDVDGQVTALAVSGSTVYAGGDFNNVNTETSISTVARNYLAAFSSGSGVAQSWDPEVDSDVYALAISGSTIYAGGDFSNANTATTPVARSYLAAFNNTDGTATAWDPEVDSDAFALAVSNDNNTIYVGGDFNNVNLSTTPFVRNYLAAFNNTDGTTTAWNPDMNGDVGALAIDSNGIIYAGGAFTTVNGGTPRSLVAAFDPASSSIGAPTSWNPNVIVDAHMVHGKLPVDALAVDNGSVYIGGTFSEVGLSTRTDLASVNIIDGTARAWDPEPNMQVYTLLLSGTTLYAGGKFHTEGSGAYDQNSFVRYDDSGLNSNPDDPFLLGPSNLVTGGSTNNDQPTLTFALTDPDDADTVSYEIIISQSSNLADISSYVVDYDSVVKLQQGMQSFTVGQSAGGGSYTVGSSGQTLSDGNYYWEVKAIDNHGADSSYSVANLNAFLSPFPLVAFTVDTTSLNISGISVSNISTSSATIQFSTDSADLSSTIIDYGTSTSYGLTNISGSGFCGPTCDVTASLIALSPNTTYDYRITTFDNAGNKSQSANQTFTTPADVGVKTNPTVTKWGVDGPVNSMQVASDGTVYVGGSFANAGTVSGGGVILSPTTGLPASTYPQVPLNNNCTLSQCYVFSSIPDGSGGYYIGGGFTYVGTIARNGIAHINADGTLDMNFNPDISGAVYALVLSPDGTTLYAGGDFTLVNQSTNPVLRNNIAAFNTTTGTVTAWNPNIEATCCSYIDVGVMSIVVSADGNTVYVGGSFDAVNGTSLQNGNGIIRGNAAAFDATTGLDTGWNPNVDGSVDTMMIIGSKIYLGGEFTTANQDTSGVTRGGVAAFNLTDGTVDNSWDPQLQKSLFGRSAQIYSMVNNTGIIYLGGDFDHINLFTPRNNLASVDEITGTDTGWDPAPDSAVISLALSGSTIYAGGNFNNVNTDASPVKRNYLAAFNTTTGAVTSWDPEPNSNVTALALSGSTIYTGGYFDLINTVPRNSIAAFDASGNLTSFDPDPNSEVDSLLLSSDDSTLYAGGTFLQVNQNTTPVNRSALAAFNTSDGSATSFDPSLGYSWCTGSCGDVLSLAFSGDNNTLYVGGSFDEANVDTSVATRSDLAAFAVSDGIVTAWDPETNGAVYTLGVAGSTIYAGGAFGNVNISTTPLVRNSLAAFNDSDGTGTAWDPEIDSSVTSLAVSDSTIYAGGNFSNVNTTTTPLARNEFAAFNNTDGTATSFDPAINISGAVNALAVSGGTVYVGGSFYQVNSNTTMLTRNDLAAFDTTTGDATVFDPDVECSNAVTSLLVNSNNLYAGVSSTGCGALLGGAVQMGNIVKFDTVSITPVPDAPTASVPAGTYVGTQSVSLSSTGAINIYYTTDGSTPVCSVSTLFGSSISVSSSETIKAIGCNGSGGSTVASFAYVINGPAPSAPVASPVAGTYTGTQSVSLSSTWSSSMYYTTDGSTPSCSVGNLYSSAISVSASETIKAIGCYNNAASSVSSFSYTINSAGGGGSGSPQGGSSFITNNYVPPPTIITPVNPPTTPIIISPMSPVSAGGSTTGCTSTTKYSPLTGNLCPVIATAPITSAGLPPAFQFKKDIYPFSTNSDVKVLQIFLNNNGFTVSTTGAGSKGHETNYFGIKTMQALITFQNFYKSDILTPQGLKKGTGILGPYSRKIINKWLVEAASL